MNPFPNLPPEQYDDLLRDIEQRGIVYPIIRDQYGRTIDGHQRERVAATLGIEPPVKVIEVTSDLHRESLAIALNAFRRQLSSKERKAAILRLAPTGMTQADIGRAVGVSQRHVGRVLASAEQEGLDVGLTLDQPPAVDKQGRAPGQRGGRGKVKEGRIRIPNPHGRPPPWVKSFTLWVHRVKAEHKSLLLRMREDIDRAIQAIEEEAPNDFA